MSSGSSKGGDGAPEVDGSEDGSQERQGSVGARVERTEDPGFLTGRAKYADDLAVANAAHAAVLRSQYGHAEIREMDTSDAEAMDGVVAVFTGADMDAADTPAPRKIPSMSTDYIEVPPDLFRPVVARDKARYQGEPLGIVVAEDRYTARDAVSAIDVSYDRLDAVVDAEAALADDAPTIHESRPDNLAYEWSTGDEDAVEAAFEDAAHTATVTYDEQRVLPDPMEPRGAVAEFDPSTDEITLQMSTQTPHSDRHALAGILQHPEHKIHVDVPRVGGGFGAKIHNYDVEALVPWCARELERPVRWQESRSAHHQTASAGRGMTFEGELALDEDGRILGLRAEGLVGVGGYVSSHIHMLTTIFCVDLLPGQYEHPAMHVEITGALTNTAPLDSYRGVHEVPAIVLVERLMDRAADEVGLDPVEVRRRNMIEPDQFPYESVAGLRYDSGDYQQALDEALEMVGYDDLRERQADLREEDRYLGVGVSCYVQTSGVGPADICKRAGIFKTHWESGRVAMHPSGTVTAYCGTMDFGMGHETAYAQILSDELGVPIEDVEVIEGDTKELNDGTGTHASRSLVVGGSALVESAREVVDKARTIAADHLEAAEEDVEFEDGEFHVAGAPDRSLSIQQVASMAHRAFDLPVDPGLEATNYWLPEELTITAGTHVAVVEVDPDTGDVSFERYVAVDDVGNRVNPMIVEGQLHGGIAQAIGEVLYEDAVYDDNGNMVASTFQDYAIPKSMHVPEMEIGEVTTPAPSNPLGAKGVGETGPIAGTPAVINAVCDALEPFGYDGQEVSTPFTNEDVWRIAGDGGE